MKCNINELFSGTDINVSELCKEVGISRTAYYNIVSSKSIPKLDTAFAITEYLSKTTEYHYQVTFLWTE